ncbi:hypothetical protein Amsp01_001630 [Amycolatopsis sp. NBRC 101858]|uniref:hypothetical protein n=1 Tax=Amycolatopsis sp. NBRC 101858 TaxID=3032200 RepID=UPI0024A5A236|nr:hypothetical protein [Amycolatopsis sp. NBRC 101858]GLY34139.1 hypothetical protein Amsp01_001630 [Amycolatopsis sp. NBRC 101858]
MTDVETRLRAAFEALADSVEVEPADVPAPRRRVLVPALVAAVVLLLAGATFVASRDDPRPATLVPAVSLPRQTHGFLPNFALTTHCGVDEMQSGLNFFEAEHPLYGPNGGAPAGWGDPYQEGTMYFTEPGAMEFRDNLGHTVRFRIRPGATAFKHTCAVP